MEIISRIFRVIQTMPITSTDMIMDADFRGQKAWATMYGKKMLNPDLYIAGQVTV